jgi:hypothetical protein
LVAADVLLPPALVLRQRLGDEVGGFRHLGRRERCFSTSSTPGQLYIFLSVLQFACNYRKPILVDHELTCRCKSLLFSIRGRSATINLNYFFFRITLSRLTRSRGMASNGGAAITLFCSM